MYALVARVDDASQAIGRISMTRGDHEVFVSLPKGVVGDEEVVGAGPL